MLLATDCSERDALPVCLGRENPSRLVSLLDMLNFSAQNFLNIGAFLQHVGVAMEMFSSMGREVSKLKGVTPFLDEEFVTGEWLIGGLVHILRQIQVRLPYLREDCKGLGLRASVEEIDRILRFPALSSAVDASDTDLKQLTQYLFELSSRIEDEMKGQMFLALELSEHERYRNPTNAWAAIIDRFPDAQEDIEEMSKCFALSRYTASVFHALMVVEHGLLALGKYVGVPDPKPGWDATYNRVRWLLDNRSSVPPNVSFSFLEQIMAPFVSMKLAWRNKVNHAAGRLVISKGGFTDVSG